jgi:hypothetical protein
VGGIWRPFDALPTQSGGFTGSPAICDSRTTMGGIVVVGRRATGFGTANRFRFSLRDRIYAATNWADIGTRTFNSKPACAVLDEFHQLPMNQCNFQKAIIGRSSLNRYFIQILKAAPGGVDENNIPLPTITSLVLSDWLQIGTNTYDSAPAATVAFHTFYLVGRRGTRLFLRANPLNTSDPNNPYNHAGWGSEMQSPALPSGWTMAGDPAIVNSSPYTHTLHFAVRGTSGAQTRIFMTNWNGAWAASWSQLSVTNVAAGSDPALDVSFDWLNAQTVYIRGTDNRIYQSSSFFTDNPFEAIQAQLNSNTGMSGSPAAIGWMDAWEGDHAVVGVKNGQFVVSSNCPDPEQC